MAHAQWRMDLYEQLETKASGMVRTGMLDSADW